MAQDQLIKYLIFILSEIISKVHLENLPKNLYFKPLLKKNLNTLWNSPLNSATFFLVSALFILLHNVKACCITFDQHFAVILILLCLLSSLSSVVFLSVQQCSKGLTTLFWCAICIMLIKLTLKFKRIGKYFCIRWHIPIYTYTYTNLFTERRAYSSRKDKMQQAARTAESHCC